MSRYRGRRPSRTYSRPAAHANAPSPRRTPLVPLTPSVSAADIAAEQEALAALQAVGARKPGLSDYATQLGLAATMPLMAGIGSSLGSDIVNPFITDLFGGGAGTAAAGASPYPAPILAGAGDSAFGPPNVLGIGRGTAAAPSMLGGAGGALSALAPYAGAIAAPLVVGGSISGIQSLAEGEDLSFGEQAALALPTFGASFLANPLMDLFGSGKNEEQKMRDELRDRLAQTGIAEEIDGSHFVTLSDGTKFDIGRDGHHTQGEDVGFVPGAERLPTWYEASESQENSLRFQHLANAIAPLAHAMGGEGKTSSQMATTLTHAAMSSANPRKTVADWYRKMGFTGINELVKGINEMVESGKLEADKAAAYGNAARALLDANYQGDRWHHLSADSLVNVPAEGETPPGDEDLKVDVEVHNPQTAGSFQAIEEALAGAGNLR